jgi:hypothetical protein
MTQWLFDSPFLSFTVAGAAPVPASRFTRRRLWFKTKNTGKAPDNFGGDANCRKSDWQVATTTRH